MNFNRGDQVVHQNFGVGKVASIEGMNFTGTQPRLFYRVEFTRTTVWVPVGDQPSKGLRPITQKSELHRYRYLLKSTPVGMEEDFHTRKSQLEQRIEAGDFQSLCELVRDLAARVTLKPLNNYEKTLLKQARIKLANEWSIASGLTLDEAQQEIEGCLLKGRQSG
jgi:CarD family transcriptional regulator